jgi:hypothetical protein
MNILCIHKPQSKFLHAKEDKEHEILEYSYLSSAIYIITTNVGNDDHGAHETRHNKIFMDARIKRSSCIFLSFVCSFATSYTLRMATEGLKGMKRCDSN